MGEPPLIGAAIGPIGQELTPVGRITLDEARSAFSEQVLALLEAGPDVMILETFSDIRELREAILAVKQACDLPIMAQMTFTADGLTPSGDAPADVKRALVEVEAPPPRDWRSLLEEMAVNNRDEASRTWSRPNRRWLANNEWRPGYDRTKINRIAVCMDVSGSMNNEAISEGKRVVAELMENHIISHATLIATDTGITAMGDVSDPQEILDFNLGRTGGGTNFIAAMKKVAELSDCVGCVFLTDMQTDYFGEDPGIPTLWVDWTTWNHGYKPKFGTVTKFKTQGAN